MQSFFSTLSRNSRSARRDQVLFELMYAGGLRVSEALGLWVGDVDWADSSERITATSASSDRTAGKRPDTTLIKRVLAHLSLPAGSLYTQEVREQGTRTGFELVMVDGWHVRFCTRAQK